jgi:hypothetical protein
VEVVVAKKVVRGKKTGVWEVEEEIGWAKQSKQAQT